MSNQNAASDIGEGRRVLDAALVSRLVATQFPQWADLPVRPVALSGWDNRTFHLGDHMLVRLPSAADYALQVEKEQRWLPGLAPHLPLPVPVPLAMGEPADSYPWKWSIYRWLDGETASLKRIGDLTEFAFDLARFLVALQAIDPAGGPLAGSHNFYRGGALTTYDGEVRRAITDLRGRIDVNAATQVWDQALATTWTALPVWIHGDVSPGNLLVREGRLSAVIDFGLLGIGDPACDLAIAWRLFRGKSREIFRAELRIDDATWARGRGWALWKASISVAGHVGTNEADSAEAMHIVREVIMDHVGRD